MDVDGVCEGREAAQELWCMSLMFDSLLNA